MYLSKVELTCLYPGWGSMPARPIILMRRMSHWHKGCRTDSHLLCLVPSWGRYTVPGPHSFEMNAAPPHRRKAMANLTGQRMYDVERLLWLDLLFNFLARHWCVQPRPREGCRCRVLPASLEASASCCTGTLSCSSH